GGEVSRFVAHFFVFGASRDEATARTHEMTLEEPLWSAFDALLAAARFWDMPTENRRCGLDGSTYTLEAWKAGRRHKVVRWSPNPIFSGGELIAVVTDYLERLGELAVLECDAEMRGRYVPEYVPLRQHYPRGNLALEGRGAPNQARDPPLASFSAQSRRRRAWRSERR